MSDNTDRNRFWDTIVFLAVFMALSAIAAVGAVMADETIGRVSFGLVAAFGLGASWFMFFRSTT